VAIVAYWLTTAVWYVAFPSEHFLAWLQKQPPETRGLLRRISVISRLGPVLVWSALILGTASLAAFRKQNWARWAFVGVFVTRELIVPLIILAYVLYVVPHDYRQVVWEPFWKSLINVWGGLSLNIIRLLNIAAIVAVFTGNANDWFRRPAAMQPIGRVQSPTGGT